jgi:hypothetical protein
MTNESFQRGYVALTAAFPGTKFNAPLLWQTLNDLDGQVFLMAVLEIVKTVKELYPGSNIIAIIREKAGEVAEEIRSKNVLKLESETEKERIERWKAEAVPMPEDCRIALEKLGLKTLPLTGKEK